MSRVFLDTRVVEVNADRGADREGERWSYGSGCIVSGSTVLTCAHVVADAVEVKVRDPAKVEYPAQVTMTGGEGGPDLALLDVPGLDPRPPLPVARLRRDYEGSRPTGLAVGYPDFGVRRGSTAVRETVEVHGDLALLSGLVHGLHTLQAVVRPERVPKGSSWAGMSGAPVLCQGHLVCVVSEHAGKAGTSSVTLVPLTALEHDPAHELWGPGVPDPDRWWSALGVSRAEGLLELPRASDREPAYLATVRAIARRTALSDRAEEVAALEQFATGAGNDYLHVRGAPWSGKTSLLARAPDVAGIDRIFYFLSRREADADSGGFLAAVVPQLAHLLDEPPPAHDHLHAFRSLWDRAVQQAAGRGRSVLLVVDGLDEDLRPRNSPSVASLLPFPLEPDARVLASSRIGTALADDLPHGHPLHACAELVLTPTTEAADLERRALTEISDVVRRSDGATQVLGFLAAAAAPLSMEDLAVLTRDSSSGQRFLRTALKRDLHRILQEATGNGGGRWQFAHETLLTRAQHDDVLADPAFAAALHAWADDWSRRRWTPEKESDGREVPAYLLDSYPSTLHRQPERLARVAGDLAWVIAALERRGVDQLLPEMEVLARASEPHETGVAAVVSLLARQAATLRELAQEGARARMLRLAALDGLETGATGLYGQAIELLRGVAPGGPVPVRCARSTSYDGYELGRSPTVSRVVGLVATPGGRVVSLESDGWLRSWMVGAPDPAPVEIAHTMRGASALAMLPDGRLFVAGGRSLLGRPAIVDPVTGDLLRLGSGRVSVEALSPLPDGRMATVTRGQLVVWDPDRPGDEPVYVGELAAPGLAFLDRACLAMPDGHVITVGSQIQSWDPATGTARAWQGPDPAAATRHYDYSGTRALLRLAAGEVLVLGEHCWRVDPRDVTRPPVGLPAVREVSAAAALDEGAVVLGRADGEVARWDPATPDRAPVLLGRHDGAVTAVVCGGDGSVLTAGEDGRIRAWHLRSTIHDAGQRAGGRADVVEALAVLSDGQVVTAHRETPVRLWDATGMPHDLAPRAAPWHNPSVLHALPSDLVLAATPLITAPAVVLHPRQHDRPPRVVRGLRGLVAATAVRDGRIVSACHDGEYPGASTLARWRPTHRGLGGRRPVDQVPGRVEALVPLRHGGFLAGINSGAGLDPLWEWRPQRGGPRRTQWNCGGYTVQLLAGLPSGDVVAVGYVIPEGNHLLRWADGEGGRPPTVVAELGDWPSALVAWGEDRVATATSTHVTVWELDQRRVDAVLDCSARALVATRLADGSHRLAIAHAGHGWSLWTV